MGDIADMIIDGDMCEWCGTWLDDGLDFPHLCPECKKEQDSVEEEYA